MDFILWSYFQDWYLDISVMIYYLRNVKNE